VKLHRIEGSGTPIFAILSKDYRYLQQITRKLQRTKYKTYIKYKNVPTKADPSTYMTLIVIPAKNNEVRNVKQRYRVAVAKNVREALRRREKAKALSAYRDAFDQAAYTARILNLVVSSPKSKHRSLKEMIPSVQTMKQALISKQKPPQPRKNAPIRDAKRRLLMAKIINGMDLC
jgi:hypothetical protein